MNAKEAKAISKENANRLAEEQLSIAKQELGNEILKAAKQGKYFASIFVKANSEWATYENTRRLEDHFKAKGFSVEAKYHGPGLTITCSWIWG